MIKYRIYTLRVMLFQILLCSCGQSISENEARRDDFSSYQELKRTFRTYEADLFLGRPQNIDLVGDWLAVYDIYDNEMVTWVSTDFKKTKRGFSIGNGPGEFISRFDFIPTFNKKDVLIYDRGVHKFKTYSVNDAINGRLERPSKVDSIQTKGLNAAPLGKNYIIGEAKTDMKLFTLVNRRGKEIARFGDYPGEISRNFHGDNNILYLLIQTLVASNTEKNVVVAAGYMSDLLCFYQVDEKGNATLLNQYRTYDSDVTVRSFENGGGSAQYNDNTRTAYTRLYPTKSYLFALYGGYLTNDAKNHRYIYLQVFDWNGNFVKGYKLDARITSMAVDEDKGIVYGLWGGAEPHIRIYELEGLK